MRRKIFNTACLSEIKEEIYKLNKMKRFEDWLNQADEDLKAARDSKKTEHFEWGCFQAHQSAKKSLKSFLLYLNIDSWGHGLLHLLKELRNIIKDSYSELEKELLLKDYDLIKERCQELDMHYIQPRYPNGFSNRYPAEYYNEKVAKKCIEYAKTINKFTKEKIKEISSLG